MSNSKYSWIWEYYTEFPNSNIAACNKCNMTVKCEYIHLIRHLECVHNIFRNIKNENISKEIGSNNNKTAVRNKCSCEGILCLQYCNYYIYIYNLYLYIYSNFSEVHREESVSIFSIPIVCTHLKKKGTR